MTREEAIEVYNGLINQKIREAFEFFVPELAESEDERIRKFLVEYHSQQFEKNRDQEIGLFHKDALAYLEKQKEPTTEELYAEAGTTEKEYMANTMKQVRAFREKQKEQKPADRFEEARKKYQVVWSEEDERMLDATIQYIGNTIPADYDEKEITAKDCKDWLKFLPKRFNLQPKQEWSEEDEKMRNLIVAIFEVNHPDGFFKANELDTTDMRGVHTEEIISWLKSLRPSWRPSEEQMDSLRDTIVQTKGYSYSVYLPELYEHLKGIYNNGKD